MNERRQRRIEALLKERIAEIIDRDLSDPEKGLITVTRVKVDRDLQVCHVYWSVLGGPAEQKRNAAVLTRAGGFIQREVAPILRTRTMPRLKFVHDEGLELAMKLEGIFGELRAARGETDAPETLDEPPADSGDPDAPGAGSPDSPDRGDDGGRED